MDVIYSYGGLEWSTSYFSTIKSSPPHFSSPFFPFFSIQVLSIFQPSTLSLLLYHSSLFFSIFNNLAKWSFLSIVTIASHRTLNLSTITTRRRTNQGTNVLTAKICSHGGTTTGPSQCTTRRSATWIHMSCKA
jgi:hypothetical protein